MNNFKPNENFKYYMYFIEERMNIFWKRVDGVPPPYSEDKILKEHKFTNVYRVLDRSSQYLVKNVIENGKEYTKEEMIFRIMLYKHFNLGSTWDSLIQKFGDIDLSITEQQLVDHFFDMTLRGETLYSGAYMVTTSFMRSPNIMGRYNLVPGMPKYRSYMRLLFKDLFEHGLINEISESKTMEECFKVIYKFVGFADFTSYQVVQDFNYSRFFDFDDNSFCSAGPGTIMGIEKTFDIEGKPDYQEIVKWVKHNFISLLREYKVDFIPLNNHLPTVPDLSNCFCETSKYLKGLFPGVKFGDKRIKQKFKENNKKIEYVFPSKWNVGL